jgi:hypothetical protein
MNVQQPLATLTRRAAAGVFQGVVLALCSLAPLEATGDEKAISPESFDKFDLRDATFDDLVGAFGEPIKYVWGDDEFSRQRLPERFIAIYLKSFHAVVVSGQVQELRHEGDDGYAFAGRLKVGATLDEALAVLGQPAKTVSGQKIDWQDDVLYKNADGRPGVGYYAKARQHVRVFLYDDKVKAIYVTRPDGGEAQETGFGDVTEVDAVNKYDDVRWKDSSKLDLSARRGLVATLSFHNKTRWPKKLPKGEAPDRILKAAMNPGLGVRALHTQGVTGQGVNVAIIDQPLWQDHPELAGKIVKYFDSGCQSETSMHGPAVASLLVGARCGTAPGARLYYAAAPSWLGDSAYYARCLDWIVEQNASLADGEKIRVVSVSAAPSGLGSPFAKNQSQWDDAYRRAALAGILVLDCTTTNGFIGPCYFDPAAREKAARCQAGFPGLPFGQLNDHLLAPCSMRTTAEHYERAEPSYVYWGRGGLSWAIPYAAGVMAMGWQLAPGLTADQMKELLVDSAYVNVRGAKFINPPKFIALVKKTKAN